MQFFSGKGPGGLTGGAGNTGSFRKNSAHFCYFL